MRRADRLFQLMLLLQEGKVVTARYLGEKLEVSERTIYRDIGDLVGSGIPIDGEAGVGYLLRDEYRLPPLMFTADELKALALGARMVKVWSDTTLGSVTASAIRKIESILPPALKKEIELQEVQVPDYHVSRSLNHKLDVIRRAANQHLKLGVVYRSLQGEVTERIVWPLVLYYWGSKWTIGAWCELRDDFRAFRVDLMTNIEVQDVHFETQRGRDLETYLKFQSGS